MIMDIEHEKGFNANQLKLIAIAAMTLDHLVWTLFPGYNTEWYVLVFHMIGRLTDPIMWFFIAEGYHYTHDVKKYAGRLFLLAAISHFAYNLWTLMYAAVYFVFIDKVYAFIQLFTCLTIPLLWLYNGKRGKRMADAAGAVWRWRSGYRRSWKRLSGKRKPRRPVPQSAGRKDSWRRPVPAQGDLRTARPGWMTYIT